MPTTVPAVWRKSSRSQGAENCVEVATVGAGTGVRDSKSPAGPALTFRASQWSSFLTAAKRGQLDLS